MHQRLRNSQVTIFSSFVLFAILWVLYILSGVEYQFGLPAWDVMPNSPNYTFIGPAIRIIGLLAILIALLGSGTFLTVVCKQAIARDRCNLSPFVCILLSLLILALPISLFIAVNITPVGWLWRWHLSAYTGLIFPISILGFILLTLLGNLLRFIQGIKSHELSWRFLLPTLLPSLIIITLSGITAFVMAWSSIYLGSHALVLLKLAFPAALIIGTIFVGVSYFARKVRRMTFSTRLLRLTFVSATLTVLAMLSILILLLVQTISMDLYANTWGRTLLIFAFSNILVICFAFPTIFACLAFWRGFVAQRELALA